MIRRNYAKTFDGFKTGNTGKNNDYDNHTTYQQPELFFLLIRMIYF